MSEQKPVYDIKAAQEAIAADAERRAEAAAQEYNAAVTTIQEKWQCTLLYIPQFTPDGRIVARPVFAPR